MPEPQDVTGELDDLIEELDATPGAATATRRRGGAPGAAPEETATMRIVQRGEVWLVDDGVAPSPPPSARRGGRAGRPAADEVVWQRELARLDRSMIGDWLEKLDRKLTPHIGLRHFHEGAFAPNGHVPAEGRILLLVHGTFSNGESFLRGFEANPEGREFLQWATSHYDAILSFDHATLGMSPLLNARALGLALHDTRAHVDVICHSRGGLVTRWWLEGFDRAAGARRAVFVGAPLAGTGLAAPPNIRGTLSLLSNIGHALGTAAAAVPFLTVLTGVFRVVSSVTSLVAKTPAVDAAVALVPGLVAQSRVGNNQELISLRSGSPETADRYFAVRSNFESENPGWRFWRHFRRGRAADVGSDMVFDGENDLVVDTGSMCELGDRLTLPDAQVLDFGTTDRIHHTNYFEQRETLRFIRERLGTTDA